MAADAEGLMLENTEARGNVVTLAEGPNVEGVVYLRQGEWPEEEVATFHEVPWIDAASIRMRWAEMEPKDQEFDWTAIDKVLAEVKKYNAAHPGSPRTMHIRVMGGEHVPEWFDAAGVRMYDTHHVKAGSGPTKPIHIPVPYDNPEFMKQLREVYRAMYERYKDEPLVTVYHGTWSAGPWDEIYHPQRDEPLPPDYTKEKFIEGMVEQLDILIDEFSLKGKVAELPYSGKYPQMEEIDLTPSLTRRAVERLGRRSPFLIIQTNGWGEMNNGYQTISWGHTRDVQAAYGLVNLAVQALGSNAGGGWMPQGDWLPLVEMAKDYEVIYAELYPPDFRPIDDAHNMTEAFNADTEAFTGLRPWFKKNNRTLYVRDGKATRTYVTEGEARKLDALDTAAAVPEQTRVEFRIRMQGEDGQWSEWVAPERVTELPAGNKVQVEAALHTDDGCFTPRVILMEPRTGATWEPPAWKPVEDE